MNLTNKKMLTLFRLLYIFFYLFFIYKRRNYCNLIFFRLSVYEWFIWFRAQRSRKTGFYKMFVCPCGCVPLWISEKFIKLCTELNQTSYLCFLLYSESPSWNGWYFTGRWRCDNIFCGFFFFLYYRKLYEINYLTHEWQ